MRRACFAMAVLTIHPADRNSDRRWELDKGAMRYDVTHLACRSASYTSAAIGGSCLPANAQKMAFPVAPGGAMPPVGSCTTQDDAVLIVIGVGVEDRAPVSSRRLARRAQHGNGTRVSD